MDADTDLYSASRRLNTTLVSKGLLDGTNTLKFYEGADARKVINFIYDIVQRRDKDADQKESLVNTVREQKSAETRLKKTVTQLEARIEGLERQVDIATVQKNAMSLTVRQIEAQNKALQDDIAKQKTMLEQIRAQDANERRKRDQQIVRMKDKAGFDIRTRIRSVSTMTGKFASSQLGTSIGSLGSSHSYNERFSENPSSVALFHTDAATIIPDALRELTDENARLIALIRETAVTLNIFTGEKSIANEQEFETVLEYTPTSFSELSIEVNNSLEVLRELLHDPKYVSVEEVAHRDREIARLSKQLEITTSNWKDATQTMDEWNKYLDGNPDMQRLGDKKVDAEAGTTPEQAEGTTKDGGENDAIGKVAAPVAQAQETAQISRIPAPPKMLPRPRVLPIPRIKSMAAAKPASIAGAHYTPADVPAAVEGNEVHRDNTAEAVRPLVEETVNDIVNTPDIPVLKSPVKDMKTPAGNIYPWRMLSDISNTAGSPARVKSGVNKSKLVEMVDADTTFDDIRNTGENSVVMETPILRPSKSHRPSVRLLSSPELRKSTPRSTPATVKTAAATAIASTFSTPNATSKPVFTPGALTPLSALSNIRLPQPIIPPTTEKPVKSSSAGSTVSSSPLSVGLSPVKLDFLSTSELLPLPRSLKRRRTDDAADAADTDDNNNNKNNNEVCDNDLGFNMGLSPVKLSSKRFKWDE
ncbi:Afadin and alpha-actinin-binding-domain-containing protein [Limtongia smithiae]|uniref:Afadin and alpha-actinin-binding-domain-containing protein n=1 Tax=Limtongia smithiae TaxID=1125753 RepID=UPI0034CE06D5